MFFLFLLCAGRGGIFQICPLRVVAFIPMSQCIYIYIYVYTYIIGLVRLNPIWSNSPVVLMLMEFHGEITPFY